MKNTLPKNLTHLTFCEKWEDDKPEHERHYEDDYYYYREMKNNSRYNQKIEKNYLSIASNLQTGKVQSTFKFLPIYPQS